MVSAQLARLKLLSLSALGHPLPGHPGPRPTNVRYAAKATKFCEVAIDAMGQKQIFKVSRQERRLG
jgi:hypothetical protein